MESLGREFNPSDSTFSNSNFKKESSIKELEEKITNLGQQISTLGEENKEKLKQLNERRGTLIGRFVFFIGSEGKLSKFLQLFSFYTNEMKAQRTLDEEIKKLNETSKEIQTNKKTTETHLNRLEIAEQSKKNALQHKENEQKAWGIIHDVFGGEEKFNALPTLDLKEIIEKRNPSNSLYINYLQKEDVPKSVMRGVNEFGAIFFVIKDANDNIQTFFEKGSQYPGSWSDAANIGSNEIIPITMQGYWITNGECLDQSVIENLKKFVKDHP